MPTLSLTKEMINRSKPPELGWSHATLISVNSNPAKSGNGVNYFFQFQCESGPQDSDDNKGRTITYMVNTGSVGLDGSSGVPFIYERFMNFVSAILDTPRVDLDADDYNLDLWVQKTCWIKVGIETQKNGQSDIKIVDFAPSSIVPYQVTEHAGALGQ